MRYTFKQARDEKETHVENAAHDYCMRGSFFVGGT